MKKILIIVLVSLIGIIAALYVLIEVSNFKTSKLELVAEFDVDLRNSKAYSLASISGNAPLTYIVPLGNDMEGARKHLLKEYDIEVSEFSFDSNEHYIIVSVGRKIVDIRYSRYNIFDAEGPSAAKITFDSVYLEGRVYVYQMDDVWIRDEVLAGNYYYIMNENKREYLGNSMREVNKTLNSSK